MICIHAISTLPSLQPQKGRMNGGPGSSVNTLGSELSVWLVLDGDPWCLWIWSPSGSNFVAGAFYCLVSTNVLLWEWSVMCFGFPQMWTSVQLRTPACKPASTPMALSSAAVTRDMNLRMMEFIAVVMGLALETSTCTRGTGAGAFFTGVSSHFPDTSPVWDTFQCSGSQPHKTEMSHFPKGGVQSHVLVIWPLVQKSVELPFRVWHDVEEEKELPNVACWVELSGLTQHWVKSWG